MSPLITRPPGPARAALPCALTLVLAACGGGQNSTEEPGADSGPTMRILAASGAAETELAAAGASASGQERGDLGAAAAIDHNLGTRWSSAFADNQWLTVDYGGIVAIDHVRIQWEAAHATSYLLQVSDDGSSWTTIKSVSASAGGTEDWTGLGARGRYLRMQGVKRSTQYGYSIFELQSYGSNSTTPPPPPPPPPPSNPDQPGVVIKPIQATSSATENAGLSAANAIDGNSGTRWSSAFDDSAWIQFDFGARAAVGYIKLVWENAHAADYALQVSDDGKTWTSVRQVTGSAGGIEEFFNLKVNARFIRMQGVKRSTQYGYSIYEVTFKTPGSDNTMPALATSAVSYPPSGSGLVPLPTSADPLETLQFTLADGTLVTRFGFLGRGRHARERGEDWNEIGYGPNDTVDTAGNPVDKGPGNYLSFVSNYFKNRTWGFEVIDNSRVAGVTNPRLVINQYFQQAQKGGGEVFFRRFDDAHVTGYGWMTPGTLLDSSTYYAGLNDVAACPIVPLPPDKALRNATGGFGGVLGANDGCSLVLDNYPGHQALSADANGVLVPNGTNVPARTLKLGEVIELSGSFFSTRAAMDAIGDSGGLRYYTSEMTYVMGQGLRPWYGVQPRLMNAPLPDEVLQGGLGSISYDYADNSTYMFQQPHNHIGMRNMQRFVEGRRLIHTSFYNGAHNEPGNDVYTAAAGLQGAHFNQAACIGCHVNNGRSAAPTALNQRLDTMGVRTATVDAAGKQLPHPTYGLGVQMNTRATTGGTMQDWGLSVRVAGFDTTNTKLADGTPVELRKPRVSFDGPTPALYSLRAAQPMVGLGLLEAVPEADILSRVRATPDEDGVLGQANYVYDPETGVVRMGRFGWKAAKASLRHQTAAALLLDMSVTSPVYPNRDCLAGPAKCTPAKIEPGITDADLQSITRYLALLGVPAQRSLVSGFPKGVSPLAALDVNPQQTAAGAKVFQDIRCTSCHTPQMKTGAGYALAEARSQTIRPYSDLLLHDMGANLADGLTEGKATGRLWRTAPLWGLGYTQRVAGSGVSVGYLHDGRARNLIEAVMWHGGEADRARQRFAALSAADRQALLAFLQSL